MARVLSEVEEAVVRSLFAQCVKNCGGIFVYDSMATLEHVFSAGIVSKKGLGIVELTEIIENLTNEGIIKTDRIVDADFLKTYYAKHYPDQQPPIKPGTKFYWLHNTEWAYKILQFGGLVSIDDVQKKYGCAMFINMTIEEDMPDIEERYMASHTVQLKLDKKKGCLCVKFDDDKNWRELKHMDMRKAPYKILKFAYEHAGTKITSAILHKHGIAEVEKYYLDTQVFYKNSTVRAFVPFLIELSKDYILFKKTAQISPAQFEALKEALKRDLKIS